ncbi:cytochrome P450 CYP44D1 [Elysia marginata]|uniref:Cytochrome P450 CYP44D1 n=1 Tax=Elysia marginata TaxID=1093978 RepID=A0AAV4ENH4_9GAST|nr:cytochrome P450 CYP44D1 [Elysia marginata]
MLTRRGPSCASQIFAQHVSQQCSKSTAVNAVSNTQTSVPTSSNDYESCLPYSKIPGPGGLPWFGRWLEYRLDYSKVLRRDLILKKLRANYGDIVKETIAGREIIHLFHPDYIKQVYESEGKYPRVPPILESVEMYRRVNELTPGLGNSNGDVWYKLRAAVQYILMRPQKAFDFLPGQNKVAADFMEKLDSLIGPNGEVPGFNRWITRWGLESAANNCFDIRMGYFENGAGMELGDRIIAANSDVFDLSTKLYFSLPFYRIFMTPSLKELYDREDFINEEACRSLDNALERYKKALEDGTLTEDRFLFLSHMLQSENVSDKDLRTIILSILTDTLSTTSQILLNNLYNLANNPKEQETAAEEARSLLSSSGELTQEAFHSSTYLRACIKESFRLLPVGLDILRLSPCNLAIGGYQVPEGSYLCLNNYVHSLDPDVIPNPESYIPERWLRDTDGDKINPYLLTPFSLGTRMCVGRRLAEQELVMMLAKILTRYRLEWHYGKLHQHFRMLLIPDQEVKVKFIRRGSE